MQPDHTLNAKEGYHNLRNGDVVIIEWFDGSEIESNGVPGWYWQAAERTSTEKWHGPFATSYRAWKNAAREQEEWDIRTTMVLH